MARRKKLKWGETPWDKLSEAELRREVQRMYSALGSAASALKVIKAQAGPSPFWGPEGTAGRAIAKADAILGPLHKQYGDGEIYYAFFRYADDLLFGTEPHCRDNWMICDNDHMVATISGPPTTTCPTCGLPMHPISWADLAPKPPQPGS